MARLPKLAAPRDYYMGRRRASEVLPDNILLFTRHGTRDLERRSEVAHVHQRWVLIVPFQGGGEVWVDSRPVQLSPGSALLVPPLHLHSFDALADDLAWLFVTFEWPGHIEGTLSWRTAASVRPPDRTRLSSLLKEWNGRDADGLATATTLWRVLRGLFPAKTSQQEGGMQSAGLLDRVKSVAQREGETRLGLGELAARLGISESHLRTKFRHETGISIGRYLRETRLRQAAMWLREEGLSVKEAAARGGFADIYAFSRSFRRTLGRTPSSLFRRKTNPGRYMESRI